LIYLGDHIRTRVRLCANDEFIIKIPNASNHASLSVGETVKVGWAVDDCRALDA
jgi:putative spermidine/putrescine transport system ATP-binding protein